MDNCTSDNKQVTAEKFITTSCINSNDTTIIIQYFDFVKFYNYINNKLPDIVIEDIL